MWKIRRILILISTFALVSIMMLTKLLPSQLRDPPATRSHSTNSYTTKRTAQRTIRINQERDDLNPFVPQYWDEDDHGDPMFGVDKWQDVSGTKDTFLVYSAYLDTRQIDVIRIIALAKLTDPDEVICRLWLPKNTSISLEAKLVQIRAHWNMPYSAYFILCLLKNLGMLPMDTEGSKVSVVAARSSQIYPNNSMRVQATKPFTSNVEDVIHVCLKPSREILFSSDWLVEWLEFNLLLGVSHFYVYNTTMNKEISCLLDKYMKYGHVTILPWTVPLLSDENKIRDYGVLAALNDCVYRSMKDANWLLIMDWDELAIPRHSMNLVDLLKTLKSELSGRNPQTPSAWILQKANFYMQWTDDIRAKFPLITSLKTRRVLRPVKPRFRYIVKTRDVIEMGKSFITELIPSSMQVAVTKDRAQLHHYATHCENKGLQRICLSEPSVMDRIAHAWAERLMQRVSLAHNLYSYDVCLNQSKVDIKT